MSALATEVPAIFDAVGPVVRAALVASARRRRFARGEVVFHEGDLGDTFHVVTRGVFVARSTSRLGHVVAVNLFRPGACFGELVLLTPDPRRSATVASLQAGETLSLRGDDFADLRRRHAGVDRFLVAVLAARNRALHEQLLELQFEPVERRVARRLLALVDLADDDGWIRVRQDDLASLAGTTRSSANRVLQALGEEGLLTLRRGAVRVADVPGLTARAGA